MASSSGSKTPPSSGQPPATAASSSAARDCESCRTAPGIPFCRVEWSFLCSGCAAVVHGHNWVVPVNPNSSTPSPILPNYPYCPYPFPYPNPSSAAHLSSDEDDLSPAHPGRGRIQVPGTAASYRRLESVMRYREKRKSRRFVKTVRYENRRAYAELRPRVDGKFASRKVEGGGEEAGPPDETGDEQGVVVGENVGLNSVRGLKPGGGELGGLAAGVEELGRPDFIEDMCECSGFNMCALHTAIMLSWAGPA